MNPIIKVLSLAFTLLLCTALNTKAQSAKIKYFNVSSATNVEDKQYGKIIIQDLKNTTLINTIMASGENVKALTIQINDGFPFKLAPSQNGTTLNYVASSLKIVLKPGDVAKIEFIIASKEKSERNIYVAGETIE